MSKLLSVLLAALCLGEALLSAPERACPAEAEWGEPSAAEQRIAEALTKATELKFIETPLHDVLASVADMHEIPIKIDHRALDDVGVPADCPVWTSVKGISLRSALRLMLRDLTLTYVVCDEVLLITTPEEAEDTYLNTRVYPVADVVGHGGGRGSEQRGCESLVEAIKDCIVPQAWKRVGGPGTISTIPAGTPKALVVTQSQEVHEMIADFLEAVRLASRRQADGVFEPVGGSPSTAGAEKRIAKALETPTEMRFIETPLSDVIETLQEQHHEIPIEIDTRALDDVGIPSDNPITIDLRGVSLDSGLRLMLRQIDLTYLIRDEVLLITTPEVADTTLVTKIYPLEGLTAGRREAAQAEQSYHDSLIETITQSIGRESWEAVGGPGSVSVLRVGTLEALVVMQTQDVQKQIADLLGRPEFRGSSRSAAATAPSRPGPFRRRRGSNGR